MSDNTNGFTITELLVAITAASVLALSVLSVSLFFFADVMREEAKASLTLESQTILNSTLNDLRVASAVRDQNLISDPNNSPGWNTSNPDHILIVAMPALDSSNNFIIDTSQGEPYRNERVYFESEGVLYRRTLAEPLATGNRLKTTCPKELATETCPPDAELTTNFENMQFVLYDQNNAITTITAETRSIELSINMIRNVYGKPITAGTNTRITMRNP